MHAKIERYPALHAWNAALAVPQITRTVIRRALVRRIKKNAVKLCMI
jgi:hypothetical protein